MSKRIVLVRHGDDPPGDHVVDWLGGAGYVADERHPHRGDLLGEVDADVAGCIVFGGRYESYATDKYPFLLEEYRWIGACIDAGVPLLCICMGAQLLARHLGGEAGPREDGAGEFGCYLVEPTEAGRAYMPRPMHMIQSHFHTYTLPPGAVNLATSALFENQAFRYGDRTFGLQFHPEITPDGFRRWQDARRAPFDRPGVQPREEQDGLIPVHAEAQAQWFFGFLDGLFGRQS